MPPKIAGCKVLTLPSSISGKLVSALTGSASIPSALRALAVPLVEKIVTSRLCNSRANSVRPSRLAVLMIACMRLSFQFSFQAIVSNFSWLVLISARVTILLPTTVDNTIEVVSCPCSDSLSMSDSRCSTEEAMTFMTRESLPVTR